MNNNQPAVSAFTVATYIFLGAAGVGIFLCMPVVAPALVESFGFNTQQVGEFSTVQLVFISLGSVLGMWITGVYRMKTIAVACLAILIVMELVTPHMSSFSLFLVTRAISGLAGGVAMALATGALANLPGTERNFGLFLFAQIILSMLGSLVIPKLVELFGISGVFNFLLALEMVALILAVKFVPQSLFAGSSSGLSGNTSFEWLCSAASLLAILVFFIAVGCYWTFVGLMGTQSGISLEEVGWSLGIAGIGGAIGALVPTFLQQRLGSVLPLLVAACLLVGSLYITAVQQSTAVFALGAFLFIFGWYSFQPYQMGVLASVDNDGRPTMASAAVVGLGLGVGPALVAHTIESGFSRVYLVSTVGFLIALLIQLTVLQLKSRHTRSA